MGNAPSVLNLNVELFDKIHPSGLLPYWFSRFLQEGQRGVVRPNQRFVS